MRPPRRVRLVVLFGGRSAEHEVSCVSAVHVLRALDPEHYDVVPIGIRPDGAWVLAEQAQKVLASGGPAALPAALEASGPELDPLPAVAGVPDTDEMVVVLPLLHGPFGEDGTVQGLLEMAGVPYVGSGVLGSALGMDKVMMKDVLSSHRLPQPRYLAMRDDDAGADVTGRVAEKLGWPVFVKPANMGSSVGVTRVLGPDALQAAVALAFSYDEWALVEEAVAGREIEVAVLGNRDPQVSVPGEVVPGRDFYDYDDKYVADSARLLVPAPLDEPATAAVRRLAARVFVALRAEGLARVDFFYEEGGRGFLVNEINTIPGFTPISMYPKLWQASGVGYTELIDRLVDLAIERHTRRAPRIGRAR